MFYFDFMNGKKIVKSDMIVGAKHFFTTRECEVKVCKPEICKYLEIHESKITSPVQTHGCNVEVISPLKTDYPDTDGLILTDTEHAACLNFADCTPLIFYDKVKNIGAVSHAGWRGTAQKIGPVTVEKLTSKFGCKVSDITAVIGPAISICCYDVGEEVYKSLALSVNDTSDLVKCKNNKIFIDLKGINARQLEEAGIVNIDICPYCTCCDNDLFFSYRKENGTLSRHSAVLKLCKTLI